jgi:hypothetical protein
MFSLAHSIDNRRNCSGVKNSPMARPAESSRVVEPREDAMSSVALLRWRRGVAFENLHGCALSFWTAATRAPRRRGARVCTASHTEAVPHLKRGLPAVAKSRTPVNNDLYQVCA